MRRFLLALALLTACQVTAPEGPDVTATSALATDEISTSTLDAAPTENPSGAAPNADTPRPKPRPETLAQQTSADPATDPGAATPQPPEEPKSAEQVLCERTGGQWAVAGKSGAYSCVKLTRDGGKICTKERDCQGMCLARSGTCAPLMPLFGCNEVLDKEGRRVTLCID